MWRCLAACCRLALPCLLVCFACALLPSEVSTEPSLSDSASSLSIRLSSTIISSWAKGAMYVHARFRSRVRDTCTKAPQSPMVCVCTHRDGMFLVVVVVVVVVIVVSKYTPGTLAIYHSEKSDDANEHVYQHWLSHVTQHHTRENSKKKLLPLSTKFSFVFIGQFY